MSESDSFISEVSEEVRRDRLFTFLRRWGWLIALCLILIIGGAAANEWRKARARASAEAAGDALRTAMSEPAAAARIMALSALGEAGSISVIVQLSRAGSMAETGDRSAAAAELAAASNNPELPETYRALASLQRVMILGSTLDQSERLATLQGLVTEGAPFRALALEQRALAHVDVGNTDAALADLDTLMGLPDATEAVRGRAQQLVVALGGALPFPETATPPAGGL